MQMKSSEFCGTGHARGASRYIVERAETWKVENNHSSAVLNCSMNLISNTTTAIIAAITSSHLFPNPARARCTARYAGSQGDSRGKQARSATRLLTGWFECPGNFRDERAVGR